LRNLHAFESILTEIQAKQTETLVDQLAADFVGLTVSLADIGAHGLFSYWMSHHLPRHMAATTTIHHPSVLIRPLGLSPQIIREHGTSSEPFTQYLAKQLRHVYATSLGLALSDYNTTNRCFYIGVSYANHTESMPVPMPDRPDSPSLETVIGSATLVHYCMRRVRNSH
jgi:hypothetical protein|tara:strand:+ start:6321 stop:6827 length:507 start_codon:yes stop_codon:yes gene_type:complete